MALTFPPRRVPLNAVNPFRNPFASDISYRLVWQAKTLAACVVFHQFNKAAKTKTSTTWPRHDRNTLKNKAFQKG